MMESITQSNSNSTASLSPDDGKSTSTSLNSPTSKLTAIMYDYD